MHGSSHLAENLMSRDEIFSFVLSGYSSPVDGAVVREGTARQRLNKVRLYIDANVPVDGTRSPANLFGDQSAMRAFLSTTPISNRSRICVCFEEILSHVSLSLSPSSPSYESIRHSIPTLLRRCKTKANSSYRIHRAEMKEGECSDGTGHAGTSSSCFPHADFKNLQARAVAESMPRMKEILVLASSYLHEVRADEKLAARFLSELDIDSKGAGLEEGDCEFALSPLEEDDFVFGPAFGDAARREAANKQERDKCETDDQAGRFLRLKRFPDSLFTEATGTLMVLANLSVKPERSSSFRDMTASQAREMEESQTCELKVKKKTAGYKFSQCIVTQEVAAMFRDYRLSLKVLVSNQLQRSPSPLPGELYKEEIKILHDKCLDEPLLVKLQEPIQRMRVWRSVQKSLLADKRVSLTLNQIQTVYNVISSRIIQKTHATSYHITCLHCIISCYFQQAYYSEEFFRTAKNRPLGPSDLTMDLALQKIGFEDGWTGLRKLREQFEHVNGDPLSQRRVGEKIYIQMTYIIIFTCIAFFS